MKPTLNAPSRLKGIETVLLGCVVNPKVGLDL